MIELGKKILYRLLWWGYNLWVDFMYCEWNPWTYARLNMAWTNYTKTEKYKERKKIKDEHVDEWHEDYAEQAYEDNREFFLYKSRFTWKNKLKIIFTPFSCGGRHKMPFYLIRTWWYGIDTED